MPLFCRHNRYTAECPICSPGTALDPDRRRPATAAPRRERKTAAPSPAYKGLYAAAGPYDEGYEVRLERVPGGLRLAEWAGGSIRRRAPVLAAGDLRGLFHQAGERGVLTDEDAAALADGLAQPIGAGVSPGRSGELRDELRVEPLEGDRVRIARWIMRPNFGWELQGAPVMLPPARYVEALSDATRLTS